jgi:hypothetical protein
MLSITEKSNYEISFPFSLSDFNSQVEFRNITELQLDINRTSTPTLWALYFFGLIPGKTSRKQRRLVSFWFFLSENEQIETVEAILTDFPHIALR